MRTVASRNLIKFAIRYKVLASSKNSHNTCCEEYASGCYIIRRLGDCCMGRVQLHRQALETDIIIGMRGTIPQRGSRNGYN